MSDNDPSVDEAFARDIYRRVRDVWPVWSACPADLRALVVAIAGEARTLGSPAVTDAALRAERERLLRFVAGLDLRTCSLADQRERRERVHAMQRAMRVLK